MQSLNTFNITAGDEDEKCSLLFSTNIFHITQPRLENITAEMSTLCACPLLLLILILIQPRRGGRSPQSSGSFISPSSVQPAWLQWSKIIFWNLSARAFTRHWEGGGGRFYLGTKWLLVGQSGADLHTLSPFCTDVCKCLLTSQSISIISSHGPRQE